MYIANSSARKLVSVLAVFFIASQLFAQEQEEKIEGSSGFVKDYGEVYLPVNVYDNFTFSKEASPWIRNGIIIGGPGVMLLYGLSTWGWTSGDGFAWRPETYAGVHAVNGASDKWGHAWLNFVGGRFFSFIFRATGSSRNRALLEGAALMEATGLICEIGDGFSPDYGFDPYDFLFNQFGILFGMLLDWSPKLDGIFTFKWEYYPSRAMKKEFSISKQKWDFATDYSGSKYIFTVKLGGIPYLSQSPLRYLDIDTGYYTRGYRDSKYYPSRKRVVYLGLSMNFSFLAGDLMPAGYASSTIQSVSNYFHAPWDIEVHKNVLSDRPHDEFD